MARYSSTRILRNRNGRRYYGPTLYPTIPLSFEDTYVITQIGDRFDILAQQYYGDSSLWWVISAANDLLNQSSYFPPVGVQLRIPANISNIIAEFEALNEN